jgi:tetratricopeptide (TPR) repeat protein
VIFMAIKQPEKRSHAAFAAGAAVVAAIGVFSLGRGQYPLDLDAPYTGSSKPPVVSPGKLPGAAVKTPVSAPTGLAVAVEQARLGRIDSGNGDFKSAEEHYTRALAISPDAENYCRRGDVRHKSGDSAGALEDYDHAIRLNPGYADAYLGAGLVLLEQKTYGSAIACFSRLINLEPKNAEAYYRRGLVHSAQGNFEQALKDYSSAIYIGSKNPDVYLARGKMYLENGRFSFAIIDFSMALGRINTVSADRPMLAQLYFYLGNAYLGRNYLGVHANGDCRKAIDCFRKVTDYAFAPIDVAFDAWLSLGVAASRIKDYATALDAFNQALCLDRLEPRAYYRLEALHRAMGNDSLANQARMYADTLTATGHLPGDRLPGR